VTAAEVFVIASPKHLNEWDLDLDEEAERAAERKGARLRALGRALLLGDAPRLEPGWWWQLPSWVERWELDQVLQHVDFEHAQIQDIRSERQKFAFMPLLLLRPSLRALAAPGRAELAARASAYWQSYESEMLADASDWQSRMGRPGPPAGPDAPQPHQAVPAAELRAEVSCPCQRTGACLALSLAAPDVALRVTQAMLGDFGLVARLAAQHAALVRQRCEVARRSQHPEAAEERAPARPGARALWLRAYSRVRGLLRELDPLRHWHTREVWRLLRLHRLYLDLVGQEAPRLQQADEAG
ncbi:unnamed protein product, partial [Prorocentrum cordatum]